MYNVKLNICYVLFISGGCTYSKKGWVLHLIIKLKMLDNIHQTLKLWNFIRQNHILRVSIKNYISWFLSLGDDFFFLARLLQINYNIVVNIFHKTHSWTLGSSVAYKYITLITAYIYILLKLQLIKHIS